MELIELKNINKNNKKLIGIGSTAFCYKLQDGSVLKLFKKNYNTNLILNKKNFDADLEKFSSISNDTFIGPKDIIINNNQIVGYTYPYIEGKSLYKINSKTRLLDLFKNYHQIINDIKKVTNDNFYLFDVHGGNIIFDGNIHIIDLDKCWFYDEGTKELLMITNSREVFTNMFGSIYHKRENENIIFNDKNLNYKYNSVQYDNIDSINEFLEDILFRCNDVNPTIKTVKDKIKVKKDLNSYFKM